MVFERIEKLQQDYTDKYVVVDASRPELARFAGRTGTVKTVNMSGRALVQFDGSVNIGWYDIALDCLKVIDQPLPPPEKKAAPKPEKAAPLTKQAAENVKPAGKASTADILAAARANKGAAAAAPAAGAKKPSTADILAAARANKGAAPAPKTEAPAAAKPVGGKMSTADILAAARAKKAEAAPGDEPAEPVAAQPAAEETVAEAAVEAPVAKAAKPAAGGALPKTTADIIAWCRQRDAS